MGKRRSIISTRPFEPLDGGADVGGGAASCSRRPRVAHADNPAGWRPGGYLGPDATGSLCWALPADQAYTKYAYLLKMPVPAAVGGQTTLSVQATRAVPAPSSGNTYSSGCPTVTPTRTVNLVLVGR